MGLQRLGISNPSAGSNTLIYTASGPFLASIIATNKSTTTTDLITISIVPSGQDADSTKWAYLAVDQDIVAQNTLETHRFALNQNDKVYVKSTSGSTSFTINGLKQVDIALVAGVTSYSNDAPTDTMDGMIWVDKDALGVQIDVSNPTFTGTTTSSQFSATNSVGDEGGEIKFSKAATNTTINTGVTLDVYQDKVRLFETAGTNRGGYFDMTALGAGVSTNLSPGLTLITDGSFSGQTTFSLPTGTFTSSYTNYMVKYVMTASTNCVMRVRLRSSGTDNSTTSSYQYHRLTVNGSTVNGSSGGDNMWVTSGTNNFDTNVGALEILLYRPFQAATTAVEMRGGTATRSMIANYTGNHNAASSFDSITLLPDSSATITGNYWVYGFRD